MVMNRLPFTYVTKQVSMQQRVTTSQQVDKDYSTACGKSLIFSCPAWIFHFFSTQQSLQTRMNFGWNFRGSRGNFQVSCGKFSRETRGWHAWCMKFAAFTWRTIFPSPETKFTRGKFRARNYRYLCVAGKVVWITHEPCMCLAWKNSIFSAFTNVTHGKEN